jgi:hypothetical protein
MKKYLILVLILIPIASCKSVADQKATFPTLNETEPINAQEQNTKTVSPKATSTLEINIHPLLRVSPTSADISATPKATIVSSTPTKELSHLSVRYPQSNQIRDYIVEYFGDRAKPSIYSQMIFVDVSGDHEDDLILYDNANSYAFVWLGTMYSDPFHLVEGIGSKWIPSTSISFRDVTSDSSPEIVLEVMEAGSWGTGLFGATWKVFYIHCDEISCKRVLSIPAVNYLLDDNIGGACISQNKITEQAYVSSIRILYEGFSIFGCGVPDPNLNMRQLMVDESRVTTYQWNGSEFVGSEMHIVKLETSIKDNSVLLSSDDHGVTVHVVPKANTYTVEKQNDYCQAYIDGVAVGDRFGCKRNFIQVGWQDITGDGNQEALINAFSGASVYDESGDIGSLDCAHQHFFAYSMKSGQPRQIADVTGCTIRSDLVGVYVEDLDGNGVNEIIATVDPLASYWQHEKGLIRSECEPGELEKIEQMVFQSCGFFEYSPQYIIYSWNGSSYVPAQ